VFGCCASIIFKKEKKIKQASMGALLIANFPRYWKNKKDHAYLPKYELL
jgi:hypothetical protein